VSKSASTKTKNPPNKDIWSILKTFDRITSSFENDCGDGAKAGGQLTYVDDDATTVSSSCTADATIATVSTGSGNPTAIPAVPTIATESAQGYGLSANKTGKINQVVLNLFQTRSKSDIWNWLFGLLDQNELW
jgi:hypothetical protein